MNLFDESILVTDYSLSNFLASTSYHISVPITVILRREEIELVEPAGTVKLIPEKGKDIAFSEPSCTDVVRELHLAHISVGNKYSNPMLRG